MSRRRSNKPVMTLGKAKKSIISFKKKGRAGKHLRMIEDLRTQNQTNNYLIKPNYESRLD